MRFLFIFTLLLAYQTTFACTKDTDCKGDRICVFNDSQQGQCRAPDSPNIQTSSPESVSTQSTHKQTDRSSLNNFHLNLLGLLQFGLTPSIEWGTDTTVILRARLLNTGLLSYLVAAADGGELAFGLGTSIQFRKYLAQQAQQGPYLGGGIEMMYTNTEGDETYETYFAVPQIEGGFRWKSESYFTGFGVFAGYAIPIKAVGYTDTESIITGGLVWDMGWYF